MIVEIKIGMRFKTRHKNPRFCKVVDILKTYNSKGELIKTRYVATHELLGRSVTDYDVVAATILMGLLKEETP